VARHLRGLVIGGSAPSDEEAAAPVAAGTELVHSDTGKVVGAVTSSAWSPSLGAVALAFVHRDVEPPATVFLQAGDAPAGAADVRILPLVD
jgi:glycine cleavage system aminomethyltransferase T